MLEFLGTIGVTHQTINTLVTQCEGVIAMLTQGGTYIHKRVTVCMDVCHNVCNH